MRLRRFQKLVLVILTLVLTTLSWPAFAALEDEQDRSHIDVEKTFTGITLDQVPDDLELAIHHGDTVYQLLPSINHEAITLTDVFEVDGSVTFRWHVQNLSAGEYTLTESNPDVPGYQVAVSGLGTQQLEAAPLIFTGITKISQQVMKKGYPMTDSSIFIGRMTASVGTVIVTLNTMNSSERLAIENYVTSHGSYKSPYYFFSVQEQLTEENPTFTVNGKTVEYSFSEGTIFFSVIHNILGNDLADTGNIRK